MQEALRDYLQAVEREFKTGIAAEHTYRPALERLLEAIEDVLNAVNDLKRSDTSTPDCHEYQSEGDKALKELMRLMNEIDETIPAWPLA